MLNNLDFLKKFDNLTEEKIPFLKSSFEDNVWEFELNKLKKVRPDLWTCRLIPA